VKRGPNWKWDDQDGGLGCVGTVTKLDVQPLWVRIKWDSGGENNYRYGADEAYDLEVVLIEPEVCSPPHPCVSGSYDMLHPN
jgi:hypothetical protein